MKTKNKQIIVAVLITTSIALTFTGCSDSDAQAKSKYQTCIEPENPYDEGSGHYAGYEWAIENNTSCGANSDSFNEGCEEYNNQLDAYDKCINSKL